MSNHLSHIACAIMFLGMSAPGMPLAAAPVSLQKKEPAPSFTLWGVKGLVNLEEFRGQLVYLDFWASWCGPCKQSFPFMNAMQRKYAAHGLRVIAINVDQSKADAATFLRTVPAEFTIAFDPEGTVPRQYAIKGMPSSVLIGRDGKVIFTHVGFKKIDEARLERVIVDALESGA